MKISKELSVREAKTNFEAAMREIRLLDSARAHPFITVGLTTVTGLIAGYIGGKTIKSALLVTASPLKILRDLKELL